MKKCSKWILVTIVLLILFNLLPFISHAQPGPIGNIDPEGDVDAPFDGGIVLLIAAGIGYGIIKAKLDTKKKAITPFI
jgi:hypothetical protein